jgi:hypothetical protein
VRRSPSARAFAMHSGSGVKPDLGRRESRVRYNRSGPTVPNPASNFDRVEVPTCGGCRGFQSGSYWLRPGHSNRRARIAPPVAAVSAACRRACAPAEVLHLAGGDAASRRLRPRRCSRTSLATCRIVTVRSQRWNRVQMPSSSVCSRGRRR